MAEKRNPIIVHLPHPGAEHTIGRKLDKNSTFPWNNGNHHRKFIRVQGKYIENINDKSGIDDTLYFWGEWEQPSIVTKIHDVTDRIKEIDYQSNVHKPCLGELDKSCLDKEIDYPSYAHKPRLGELDKNCPDMYKRYNSKPNPEKGYQNTDPYVFGENFYYSCCRQDDKKGKQLKELKSGDLIIFYGGDKKEGKKKVRLDTVFVVKDICFEYGKDNTGPYIIKSGKPHHIRYDMDKQGIYIEVVEDKKRYYNDDIKKIIPVSEAYRNGVLNAIWYGHQESKAAENFRFVLYSGATKEKPVNGMFSYFICKTKKDGGNKGFPRMSYDVDNPLDNEFGFSFSLQSLKKRVDNKTILDYAICKTKNKDKDIQINNITDYWKRLTQDIVKKGYKLGISAEEPIEKNQVTPQKD